MHRSIMEEQQMTEGGIQYNCKNTIIDVNELNEIIHELEALK